MTGSASTPDGSRVLFNTLRDAGGVAALLGMLACAHFLYGNLADAEQAAWVRVLEGRFREGLFYPDEGHVEPRRVLPELHARIVKAGEKLLPFDVRRTGSAEPSAGITATCGRPACVVS